MYYLQCLTQSVVLNKKIVPKWAQKIKRWNQLDGAAFTLAEVSHPLKKEILGTELVVLSSSLSSIQTDHEFYRSPSAAKFVHTLPNVRATALLQVCELEVPVLSMENGQHSLFNALEEAISLVYDGSFKKVLIASIELIEKDSYRWDIFTININGPYFKSPHSIDYYCTALDDGGGEKNYLDNNTLRQLLFTDLHTQRFIRVGRFQLKTMEN